MEPELASLVNMYKSRLISAKTTVKIGECLGLSHERVHAWIIRERAMLCDSIKDVYIRPVMAYLLTHSSRHYLMRKALTDWRDWMVPPLIDSSGDDDNRAHTLTDSSSEEDDSNWQNQLAAGMLLIQQLRGSNQASASMRWVDLDNSGRIWDAGRTAPSNGDPNRQDMRSRVRRWSHQRHWGLCADDCGCCRARSLEAIPQCEECSNGWVLTTVSKEFKRNVRDFAVRKYPRR